ncbi:MAG: hypothetical protein H6735_00715 [Alphaproteobacteria bacterium]|nr:hypothetical protein [Alphaproteobacteria bacterium]
MFHLVARSADGRFLFRTWVEGLALWRRVLRVAPRTVALVVMPDHLHLLHASDNRLELAQALSGYARWRNRARGERGRVFEPLPSAIPIGTGDKRSRAIRYVHLNPCRARLVSDPLAWPLSTHRDALGLALPAAIRAHADPEDFHRYVSSDPSVNVDGTELPKAGEAPDPERVLQAISALTRTPVAQLRCKGPARNLLVGAMRELCPEQPVSQVHRTTAWRRRSIGVPTDRVVSVLADPRFAPLQHGDLRAGWREYRQHR